LRLVGNKNQRIEAFSIKHIKRVRIIHRADGYYCQFAVQAERHIEHVPTGKRVGIDVGLKSFYTDSEGTIVDNPRYYRKAEKRLKRLHRQLCRKQKKSSNRKKARKQLARAYLKVSRQREDFARKTASTLVSSHDLIAYEDLKIRNLVKNHHLAKSIHDAGWRIFLRWVKYYATLHNIPVIAVAPHFTSQACSACGRLVKKSLSVRTHICTGCGAVLDRDHNAALNILARTVGHTGTSEPVSENAWGEVTATVLSAMVGQQVASQNQEPPVL
jgi:putative transposase